MELEPWIETYSGIKFEFLNPKPHMITITDIAHSLSRQCRFSGHTSEFYSVAEHCVNVAIELAKYGPEVQMQGLLHDASEAYLLDVPSPVKQYLTNYKEMEETIQKAIFKTYGITYPYAQVVKDADAVLLKKEAQKLLPSQGNSWVHLYPTPWESDIRIECLKSDHAYGAYIAWFNFLIRETNMPRGRKKLFNDETVDWIIANPEQLSYSELAIKFSCSIQTIKRLIHGKGAYRSEPAQEVV